MINERLVLPPGGTWTGWRNGMNFEKYNTGKCKVFCLGWNNPMCQNMLAKNKNSFSENALVDTKLDMKQKCTITARRPTASWAA